MSQTNQMHQDLETHTSSAASVVCVVQQQHAAAPAALIESESRRIRGDGDGQRNYDEYVQVAEGQEMKQQQSVTPPCVCVCDTVLVTWSQ